MTRVCISGYYGFDNFGDETILKVLTENLKAFSAKPEITVFSSNPSKTSQLYGIDSVNSFDFKSVIKTIKNSDCLISGGGSLLQDVTSWKSLVYYLGIIMLAKFFRKKVIIFAQGIGPINNKFLAKLTSILLKKSDYVSVRDEKSFNLLKSWGVKSNLCSDPVWNLKSLNVSKSNKICVQLRSFPTLTLDFMKNLASCVYEFYSDKEICILSLQNKLDLEVCKTFYDCLKTINPDVNVRVVENTSNEKVIEDIEASQVVISMRYHSCLVAIKDKIKLLPISYDIKVENLAKEFSLDYIDILNSSDMKTTFINFVKSDVKYNDEQIESLQFDFSKIEKLLS